MAIYISKPGVMCGAGCSLEELQKSVIAGNQNGIKKIKACNDKEYFVSRIQDKFLKKSSARYDMRIMRIEEAALNQIEDDIKTAINQFGPQRIAVCVGSCDNGTEFSVAGHRKYFENKTFSADYNLEIQGADYVSTFIAEKYGIKGAVNTFSTACSSSAGATIKAAEIIMAGLADAVIAGGIDIASDTVLLGFDSLEAVSPEITNPFSKNRKGITLGEAGVFYILSKEPLKSSKNNKNVILLGWGESADAYHNTSPDPTGSGAKKAMEKALKSAKITKNDIDYINLHGTGTKFNDSMEAKAVNAVFGDLKVPVSTTKPITGHTLGAAAGLELAVCFSVINNAELPVQVWDKEYDCEFPKLNFVNENYSRVQNKKKTKICLSNSFAFGGANACLVIASSDIISYDMIN